MSLKNEHEYTKLAKGLEVGSGIKISNRHKAFIAEYIKCWDATAAARKCHYKNAKIIGSRLVNGESCPAVAKVISRYQAKMNSEAILESQELQKRLSQLVDADITNILDRGWIIVSEPKDLPNEFKQCIKKLDVETIVMIDEDGDEQTKYKVKFELYDKLKAFDLLCRMQGLFAPEKQEIAHGIDWDSMYAGLENDGLDTIEGTIAKAKGIKK